MADHPHIHPIHIPMGIPIPTAALSITLLRCILFEKCIYILALELSVGRPHADPTWKRPPGRPRTKWTDQLRRDNSNVPIATLCRQAINWSRSLESDATVRADYALATTTTGNGQPREPTLRQSYRHTFIPCMKSSVKRQRRRRRVNNSWRCSSQQ